MFSDLLCETIDFKYQITLKTMLKKYKTNGEIEFRPVCFNSTSDKPKINSRKILHRNFVPVW